jgi:hypothetical protein
LVNLLVLPKEYCYVSSLFCSFFLLSVRSATKLENWLKNAILKYYELISQYRNETERNKPKKPEIYIARLIKELFEPFDTFFISKIIGKYSYLYEEEEKQKFLENERIKEEKLKSSAFARLTDRNSSNKKNGNANTNKSNKNSTTTATTGFSSSVPTLPSAIAGIENSFSGSNDVVEKVQVTSSSSVDITADNNSTNLTNFQIVSLLSRSIQEKIDFCFRAVSSQFAKLFVKHSTSMQLAKVFFNHLSSVLDFSLVSHSSCFCCWFCSFFLLPSFSLHLRQ